jgi:hypothetical protein
MIVAMGRGERNRQPHETRTELLADCQNPAWDRQMRSDIPVGVGALSKGQPSLQPESPVKVTSVPATIASASRNRTGRFHRKIGKTAIPNGAIVDQRPAAEFRTGP